MPSSAGYICLYCGDTYEYTTHNKKFCSRTCFMKAYKNGRRKELRQCVICNNTYEAREDSPSRTCSSTCRGTLSHQDKDLIDHICEMCGCEFQTTSKRSRLRSQKCQNADTFDKRDGDPEAYFKVLLKGGSLKGKDTRKDLTLDLLLNLLDEQDGKCALSGQTMTFKSKLG